MGSGSMDYARDNPDTIARLLAAFAPAIGAGDLSGPLNTAAGLYGIGASGEREKEYAQKYAAAQQAVDAWKADKTKPAPTTEQLRIAAGMGAPPSTSAIAAQTTVDVAKTSQDIAARRAETLKRSQSLGGPGPSLQALPFNPRPIFAQGGSQSPLNANLGRTGNADFLAKLLMAIKAQGSA